MNITIHPYIVNGFLFGLDTILVISTISAIVLVISRLMYNSDQSKDYRDPVLPRLLAAMAMIMITSIVIGISTVYWR